MAVGVLIVQEKPTAQIYRLFGALTVLLLIMGVALLVMRIQGLKPSGSPYGGLAPVAAPATDAMGAAPTGKLPASVQIAAPAAPANAPAASVAATAPPAPPPAVTAPAPSAALAPPPEPARVQPRVITLDPSAPIAAPVPPPVVPRVAAVTPAPAAAAPTPHAAAPTPAVAQEPPSNPNLVNINTASADAMDHALGAGHIGKTIARHRPYRSIADLVDHRVLRASDFARIRARITTN